MGEGGGGPPFPFPASLRLPIEDEGRGDIHKPYLFGIFYAGGSFGEAEWP